MQESWSWVFMQPVQGLPDYHTVVKKPMDLGTVKKNLGSKPSRCRFKTYEKFAKDVRLVFQNALLYNKADANVKGSVYVAAEYLLDLFEKAYSKAVDTVFSLIPTTVDDPDKSKRRTPSMSPPSSARTSPAPDSLPQPATVIGIVKVEDSKSGVAKPTVQPVTTTPDTAATSVPVFNETLAGDILLTIMEYQKDGEKLARPFIDPVDLSSFLDYRAKIPRRMHLRLIQKKIKSGDYKAMNDFAADVRLIFSNCLVYNSDVSLSQAMRSNAMQLMKLFEKLYAKNASGRWPGIPERWECQSILDKLLLHQINGVDSALWFKFPIQTYFESADQVPYNYFTIIKRPMDLGTVSANLHCCVYKRVEEFVSDIQLVFNNCIKYWKGDPNGEQYCASAKALLVELKKQCGKAFGKERADALCGKTSKASSSSAKTEAGRSASATPTPKKKSPSRGLKQKNECHYILDLLRKHEIEGPGGVKIRTAKPFLRAVDVSRFPDYLNFVKHAMDLSKIERKLKSDRYNNLAEFSADIQLIFSNCMAYNSDPVQCADIRAMCTALRTYFESLYQELESTGALAGYSTGYSKATATTKKQSKSKTSSTAKSKGSPARKKAPAAPEAPKEGVSGNTTVVEPTVAPVVGVEEKKKKRKREDKATADGTKKAKKATEKETTPLAVKEEIVIPQLSIKTSTASTPLAAALDKPVKKTKSKSSSKNKEESQASEKIAYPEPEASYDKVLCRLLRNPLISKYHFDKPIYEAFPELKFEYLKRIKQPMDLSIMQNNLKNRLYTPDEAAPDVKDNFMIHGRLVFQNAISFNEGDDIFSVHVRELAEHFLTFFNTCCFEMVPLTHALKHEVGERTLLLENIKLMRQKREERAASLRVRSKGKELTKILRTLSNQKFSKISWPFQDAVTVLFPGISAQYFDIIKKPMDLKIVNTKLGEYSTYGDFAADVRLTFENSLLYNKADAAKEGWTVYSAAKQMLDIFEGLWANATIDIVERADRDVVLRRFKTKELAQLRGEEKKVEVKTLPDESVAKVPSVAGAAPSAAPEAPEEPQKKISLNISIPKSIALQATDPEEQARKENKAKLKLEKMSKEERKAEDRRKKRLKREEEMAKKAQRMKTAVAATDDALREAEMRSRRWSQIEQTRIQTQKQRQELVKQRQLQHQREEESKRLFKKEAWRGKLLPQEPPKTIKPKRKTCGSWFQVRKAARTPLPIFQIASE